MQPRLESPLTDQEIQRRAVVAVSGVVTSAAKGIVSGFVKTVLFIVAICAIGSITNKIAGPAYFPYGIFPYVLFGILAITFICLLIARYRK